MHEHDESPPFERRRCLEPMDVKTHTAHHEWVRIRIERDTAIRDMCWTITKAFAQWSVIGILGVLWAYFKAHWNPSL